MYPSISFPGTHYTLGNTQEWLNGGFTFSEFLKSNDGKFNGNLYISGPLNYEDPEYRRYYEEVPHGLVRRIVRKEDMTQDVESLRRETADTWKIVARHHRNLPDEVKYSQETWEWTVRREFFDHFVERAAFLLDAAINNKNGSASKLRSLVEAAAWLELAGIHDSKISGIAPSLKKNLGLAYLHMVRNNERGFEYYLPKTEDIFSGVGEKAFMTPLKDVWWGLNGEQEAGKGDWKTWATQRWSETWGEFLSMKEAANDPSYKQIKSIFDTVFSATRNKQ